MQQRLAPKSSCGISDLGTHVTNTSAANAHKHITCVPKFDRQTKAHDQCPTCIQMKQTKTPAGPDSTCVATQLHQDLSINFCFTDVLSKNSNHCKDFEGVNGKTCWILATDHSTGMKHGNTQMSKGPPLQWLSHFLTQCNPKWDGKCAHPDQGGELFNHPEVHNLFAKKGHTIHPTGSDNLQQNGPVECGH